jgi:hypothetical protein
MQKKIIFICLFISQLSFAQNMDYRNTFTLSSGRSLFSSIRGTAKSNSDTLSFTDGRVRALPTLQGTWDFALTDWFSLGLGASYNQATVSFNDVTIKKISTTSIGSASAKIARTSFALRGLFHYGKGKFDLYSGGRLGIGIWYGSIGATVNDALFTDLLSTIGIGDNFVTRRINGTRLRGGYVLPQVQFIPFGMRYYVTDNIGVNGELAIGAPYYISLGANYRF